MLEKYGLWILLAVVALYLLLRKSTNVTGGANLGITTGNNAQPYPGYPPGYYPPGAGPTPYSGASPPPPQPIYNVTQGTTDNTGSILSGVGGLLSGLGSAAGNVLTGLGNAGYLSGGSSSGGGGDSFDDGDWSGEW